MATARAIADPFAPRPYVEAFPLVDRLADVLAWALVVDRLTDEEVAWVELGCELLECVCAGLLILRPGEAA